jgi:hypothetical protein
MSSDAAGSLVNFANGSIDAALAALFVAFPCRVLSFNTGTCMASVQPLLRVGGNAPAPILNVPALGQKLSVDGIEQIYKPVLAAGDVVFVVCADLEIKNALAGQIATPDSKRRHNKNDAVIVGVFPCSLLG